MGLAFQHENGAAWVSSEYTHEIENVSRLSFTKSPVLEEILLYYQKPFMKPILDLVVWDTFIQKKNFVQLVI